MVREIRREGTYRRSGSVVFRQVGEEILIVQESRGGVSSEESACFTLEGTGMLIWSLLDGDHTVREIIEEVLLHYDAPEEQVGPDVLAFLDELASRGMISE